MKTIKEKAKDYINRVSDTDIESAYIEGANETLLTIIDRLRARFGFKRFCLEEVAEVIRVMRIGN